MHETGVTGRWSAASSFLCRPIPKRRSPLDRIKCIFAALSPRSAGSFARHRSDLSSIFPPGFQFPRCKWGQTLPSPSPCPRTKPLANLTSSCQLRIRGRRRRRWRACGSLRNTRYDRESKEKWADGWGWLELAWNFIEPYSSTIKRFVLSVVCIMGVHVRVNKFNRLLYNLHFARGRE